MIWMLLACGRTPAPGAVAPPEGFSCPSGSEWMAEVSGATEVHSCHGADGARNGPHLERFVDGGVAVEGGWRDDRRDGVWTSWFPDGAFRSQVTWAEGVEQGLRHELSADGRIVEIDMDRGLAVELRGLPGDTPMPEWHAGQRVEGVLYRAHSAR